MSYVCFLVDLGDLWVDRDSFFSEVTGYTTMNPLVTAVAIGDYSDSTLPTIQTTNEDYQNIINVFSGVYGYTVVVAQNCTNNHDYSYTLRQFNSSSYKLWQMNQNAPKAHNFKSKWTGDEIQAFNEKIKKDYNSMQFDSLIYIVSCHGDGKGLIYDSFGEEFSLNFVYYEFNNKNCRNLRNKPKIYLLDTNKIDIVDHNSGGTDKINLNVGYHEQDEKMSASDIADTKNKQRNSKTIATCTPTYTKDTHMRKIFCNSGQQANQQTTYGSIFIQCFSETAKHSLHASLTDILIKTRKCMASKLYLHKNSGDMIVLSDDSTIPYEIEFGKSENDDQTKMNEYTNWILQHMVCIYVHVCSYCFYALFLVIILI